MNMVKVVGTGSCLPARLVTNAEVAPRIDSSEEWIYSHTGIACRHVADSNESAATLGAEAGRAALKDGLRVALAGFGSGLTWAGVLSRWPYL